MCDEYIRKLYDWKYAKPMKELTQEDLKTMNKQDLKTLLGLPGIEFSTHAPFPRQKIGLQRSKWPVSGPTRSCATNTRNTWRL
jgi:hypothetical protein